MTRRLSTAWLLIFPSLALAIAVILYPFAQIVRLALSDVSRFGQIRGFVGTANFARVFADPIFLGAALRTLEWTICVVVGTLLSALPVAIVLNRPFHGRSLARTLVMLPWAVSLSMAAVVWLWAFNGDYGMINAMLNEAGVIAAPT